MVNRGQKGDTPFEPRQRDGCPSALPTDGSPLCLFSLSSPFGRTERIDESRMAFKAARRVWS